MTSALLQNVPHGIDGPSLVAAAAGLMLLPENASRHVRLHRLAAAGLTLDDAQAPTAKPNAIRKLLKSPNIGGPHILMNEDPYSEVLIQSVRFPGGPYLVSPGSGEHTVADLENLIEAVYYRDWMPFELRTQVTQLIRALLIVSDLVLKRAGLQRRTPASGLPKDKIYVPGAQRLDSLSRAVFISNNTLDHYGQWLTTVVDSLAINPGDLTDPCRNNVTDDRLHVAPFLRLEDGFLVILPLDLSISLRFHLLRIISQSDALEGLGREWRQAALRRIMRSLPGRANPVLLEQSLLVDRYLVTIDESTDLHLILATDPLVGTGREVWGFYDTSAVLARLKQVIDPETRKNYSQKESVLHLVINDSPGRSAFWGVANDSKADPVLLARSNDVEVILHNEPDGALGLFLFAEAIKNLPGRSLSMSILDDYSTYLESNKSFYLSDETPPDFTVFNVGDGEILRRKYTNETDRHGVVPPLENPPLLEVRRRYKNDAPEIFIIEPHDSYHGYVVELSGGSVFITTKRPLKADATLQLDLLECVAYWVRESACHISDRESLGSEELVLQIEDAGSASDSDTSLAPTIQCFREGDSLTICFTNAFCSLLHESDNTAERELVDALLKSLFLQSPESSAELLDLIAPIGSKRMLVSFDRTASPQIEANGLPRPLIGHGQVDAQLLDELGEWLRSPSGGQYQVRKYEGSERTQLLGKAVSYLFQRLEDKLAQYNQRHLLDFLISQNEALIHDSFFRAAMLDSRLACFGEHSETVSELVTHRRENTMAQRANRFLIEYVAAQPPPGAKSITIREYYKLLSIGTELINRATASDFLRFNIADFEVSILESGRLGMNQDEPITEALDRYASAVGYRTVRTAQGVPRNIEAGAGDFDFLNFIHESSEAMLAEFGFTFEDLRSVCNALLGNAQPDQVTRLNLTAAIADLGTETGLAKATIVSVLDEIMLRPRTNFLDIEGDAYPWRFNRDNSYIRRPIVKQNDDIVFGFRGLQRVGPFWIENLLSGRLQSRAKTHLMKEYISRIRQQINTDFANNVARHFRSLGYETHISVKKIGQRHISDSSGNDLGDVDVLVIDRSFGRIFAVEAKDFEIARTPQEISNELDKLFKGKSRQKPTIDLHAKRVSWLRQNLPYVKQQFDMDNAKDCNLTGLIVTSEPLVTPLVESSPFAILSLDEITTKSLARETEGKSK